MRRALCRMAQMGTRKGRRSGQGVGVLEDEEDSVLLEADACLGKDVDRKSWLEMKDVLRYCR
jgi:hypothetical protein